MRQLAPFPMLFYFNFTLMAKTNLVGYAETFGWNSLSNSELLSIVTGNEENALLLSDYFEYGTPSLAKLAEFEGIGKKTAEKIKALHTLFTRKRTDAPCKVQCSSDIYNYIAPVFDNATCEEVWLMLIDAGCRITRRILLSKGSLDCSLLDVRMIVKHALDNNCTHVAIAHNHPSGVAKPSSYDIESTAEIVRGCRLMRIRLIDHLIVTKDGYYSFDDNENLDFQ